MDSSSYSILVELSIYKFRQCVDGKQISIVRIEQIKHDGKTCIYFEVLNHLIRSDVPLAKTNINIYHYHEINYYLCVSVCTDCDVTVFGFNVCGCVKNFNCFKTN